MSASRERKKRNEQVAEPVKEKKSKKLSEGAIFAICMLAIVAVLLAAVIGYGIYKNNRAVLKVGDHTVTVSEFNYIYNSKANSLSSYASYMDIDTSTPLDKQYVSENGASWLMLLGIDSSFLENYMVTDGYYNVTWAQLLAESAKDDAASVYAIYNEAKEKGYEPDEHLKEEVEENIEQMKEYAKQNNMSLNSFIKRVYGKGCNVSGYRDYLTAQAVASHYASTLTYTPEELSAKKAENPDDYVVATFYQFSVAASDFVEADENGQKPEATDAEKKQAKEAAEAMAKEFDTANESVSIKTDTTRATLTSSTTEEAANWLFDTAKDGDVKLFENEGSYYVLKLIDKIDYQTGNFLEIVIGADGEELAEGELTAAEKVEKIKAALSADASAENFKALAEEYSDSHESEAENLRRSTLASVSNDALLWGMDARTEGDFEVFEASGSTVILLYTGAGDLYSDVVATSVLASEHVQEISDAAAAECNYDEKAAMSANVGVYGN